MALPFLADGITPGKIAIQHDSRKFKSLALVIETNSCKTCQPGDVILFKEGQYEPLDTASGESFYWLDEHSVVMVLENLSLEYDKLVTNPLPY
jgi:hypothetical protein